MSSDNLPSVPISSDLESKSESPEVKDIQQNTHESTSPCTRTPVQQLDWSVVVLGFCLTSAIEIALLSLQANVQLPLSLHLVSMAMVLAFASIFMAKFVPSQYPNHAKFLVYSGVFSAATAFFLAITVALPLCFKILCWSIYALILLAIMSFYMLPLLKSSTFFMKLCNITRKE